MCIRPPEGDFLRNHSTVAAEEMLRRESRHVRTPGDKSAENDCAGDAEIATRRGTAAFYVAKRLFAQHRLAAEDVVIVLSEAMGFVAHILQEPQGERMAR